MDKTPAELQEYSGDWEQPRDAVSIAASSSTLTDYFENCAASPTQHAVLGFPKDRSAHGGYETFTPRQLDNLANEAVAYYVRHGLRPISADESAVVAILNPGDVEYTTTFLALLKLGYTVLALSLRIPPSETAGLLFKTCCNVLIHGSDASIISRVEETTRRLQPSLIPIYRRGSSVSAIDRPSRHLHSLSSPSKIAYMLHSSGSSGSPKLFAMTHGSALARLQANLENPLLRTCSMFITSSLYNSAGLTFMLVAFAKSATTFYYNDRLPYTSDGLTTVLREVRPEFAKLTPRNLELVARTVEGVDILRETPIVDVIGAMCPQDLGDRLARREGVRLTTAYAMSEAGILLSSEHRPLGDLRWDYLTPTPEAENYIYMKPLPTADHAMNAGDKTQEQQQQRQQHQRLYECVILPGMPSTVSFSSGIFSPGASNSNLHLQYQHASEPYETRDLFVAERDPKPESSGWGGTRWKFVGRRGDYISMGNARRVNASVYEGAVKERLERGRDSGNDSSIRSDSSDSSGSANSISTSASRRSNTNRVEECVLFGEGRDQLGVLVWVQRDNGGGDDDDDNSNRDTKSNSAPTAADEVEAVRETVWRAIDTWVDEVGDTFMKQFERVARHMVVVLLLGGSTSTDLPRTDKGNFIRGLVYERFKAVIEEAYRVNSAL